MKYLFNSFYIFCIYLAGSISLSRAQSQQNLIAAINQELIPLNTLSPDADFNDLEKLKRILYDKSIIGIGEATHGTHEFSVFKHRMLGFLVTQMGVKTFVIEGDFAGTQIMNDYVVNNNGNVGKGLQGIGYGVWMTQEFVDMANWLKAYNATQLPENKVRLFGCDMQWAWPAIQALKAQLSKTNEFTPQMESGLAVMNRYVPSLTAKEKTAIRSAVIALSKIEFKACDTALYRHYVRELQQYVGSIDTQSAFFQARQSDWRDKCMAENVKWIYNYTGHNKMMIWAHNEHIRKSAGSDNYYRMGADLSKNFPDKYYAMGFDFNTGSMRSYNNKLKKNEAVNLPPAKNGSNGYLLAQCITPNFILDFKSASNTPVIDSYLNADTQSVFYGAAYNGEKPHYVTQKLNKTYDALIFIKDTHAVLDIEATH